MATALAPIKIDSQTDELVSQAAHFLSHSKKEIVDLAVREYVDNHRDEIHRGVRDALLQLDGSKKSVVSMLTGFSSDDVDDLGGLSR